MPAMMRIKQGIFVSVLCGLVGGGIGACAWGDGSDPSDPGSTGNAAPVCGDGTCETSEECLFPCALRDVCEEGTFVCGSTQPEECEDVVWSPSGDRLATKGIRISCEC